MLAALAFAISALRCQSQVQNAWSQRGTDIQFLKTNISRAKATGVAISGDGSTMALAIEFKDDFFTASPLVFGLSSEQKFFNVILHVYTWSDLTWKQKGQHIIAHSGPYQTHSGILGPYLPYETEETALSLSYNGDTISVGNTEWSNSSREYEESKDQGSVAFYDWNGSTWNNMGDNLTSTKKSYFGSGLALTQSGKRCIVGAKGGFGPFGPADAGSVSVYDWDGSKWIQVGSMIPLAGDVKRPVAISAYGQKWAVGNPFKSSQSAARTGRIDAYAWNSTDWEKMGSSIYGQSTDDMIGLSGVIISNSGNRVAFAGKNPNAVYVHEWNGTEWGRLGNVFYTNKEISSISGSDDLLKIAVGFGNGNTVSAIFYDGMSWSSFGSNITSEEAGDRCGANVRMPMHGQMVVVGCKGEDTEMGIFGKARVYESVFHHKPVPEPEKSKDNTWLILGPVLGFLGLSIGFSLWACQ